MLTHPTEVSEIERSDIVTGDGISIELIVPGVYLTAGRESHVGEQGTASRMCTGSVLRRKLRLETHERGGHIASDNFCPYPESLPCPLDVSSVHVLPRCAAGPGWRYLSSDLSGQPKG